MGVHKIGDEKSGRYSTADEVRGKVFFSLQRHLSG
jgi:hypothetical protein